MKTMVVRALLCLAIVCCAAPAPPPAYAQQTEGEKLFNTICVACHTVNKGKLIGPDLANIHRRRPQAWIIDYVKSSQTVIKSGDPVAVELFEEFGKIVMPDNNLTDSQILSIVEYIAANSRGDEADAAARSGVVPETPITQQNIDSGRALFVGERRFENRGPTCVSCHHVDRVGVAAGGVLAKDLTDAYGRLGQVGLKAIIGRSPFPVMAQAFDGTPITDQEVFDVTAFLQYVSGDTASHGGPHYGVRLFLLGFGGAILLVGVFGGLWMSGKRKSVNHAIYERQIRSTWEAVDDTKRVG